MVTPEILNELQTPTSTSHLVAALRALKHELVGNDIRKDSWVRRGLLDPLSRILNISRTLGKRKGREGNGFNHAPGNELQSEEDEARLQALIIISTILFNGPQFLAPFQHSNSISAIVQSINIHENSPKIVLAALRALSSAAQSILLEYPRQDGRGNKALLDAIYSPNALDSLVSVLEQTGSDMDTREQVNAALKLIVSSCADDRERRLLADAGVLEALAKQLACFIIATPGIANARLLTVVLRQHQVQPLKAPQMHLVMEAVSHIIHDSAKRARRFSSSSIFKTILTPAIEMARWQGLTGWPYFYPAWRNLDSVLPPASTDHPLAQLSNFPPLGGITSEVRQQGSSKAYSSALEVGPTEAYSGTENEESPLAVWLLHISRTHQGESKLWAIMLLAQFFRSGLINKSRWRSLGYILIPTLIEMFDDANAEKHLRALNRTVKMNAPTVLAALVKDNPDLQQMASEADGIKKLSKYLKQTFDPLPEEASCEVYRSNPPGDIEGFDRSSRIGAVGPVGMSPALEMNLNLRRSLLLGLAGMAIFKDEYRKAIIENGVLPFIIDSLKPYQPQHLAEREVQDRSKITGNPSPVIIAACEAAKTLSRSVSTLRTSLTDGGLALPVFDLLKHHDEHVQVAATAVICNIVLEFSSMRETLVTAGVVPLLCSRTHASNAKLRLNSIWALKHLVHAADNKLKVQCLEELGTGWLKQTISGDIDDVTPLRKTGPEVPPIAMGTPNAAGEQVDLLNAVEEDSDRMEEDDDDEDEVNMIDSVGSLSHTHHLPEYTSPPRRFTARSDDNELAVQARQDEIGVQEHGLDFIRNLLTGKDSHEMIDYLFNELGKEQLFEMLAAKLRPKPNGAFARDRRPQLPLTPCPTEIVVSTCYIIVHIATGLPRHRHYIISQTELLRLIVPLMSHTSPKVRSCCVWLIINLTWMDNQADKADCRGRALELKKLGFLEKLEEMENDVDQDVKERTKTALSQMAELLKIH